MNRLPINVLGPMLKGFYKRIISNAYKYEVERQLNIGDTRHIAFTFNKEIANNPKYKRKNGDLFNLYGYDFWASSYNNEDYYGRQRINEIKNSSNVVVAGKEFIPEIGDIHALVNEYYKKPEVLYKTLAKVFEMDKNKLKKLEEENKKLKKEKDDLQKALK